MTKAAANALRKRLRAITAFLPEFEKPGFVFGQLGPIKTAEGALTIPVYMFSDAANAFMKAAYDAGWVVEPFNWPEWMGTPEAEQLRDDPAAIARADVDQLAKLLTVLLRQERFCDGSLGDAFESGLLTSILRRAAAIEAELPA